MDMKDGQKNDKFGNLFWASSLGIVLVVTTIAGLGIGLWLDKVFNSQPYCTLSFFVLGVFSGFRQIWKEIRKKHEEDKA